MWQFKELQCKNEEKSQSGKVSRSITSRDVVSREVVSREIVKVMMWSQALCLCHTNSFFWALCLPIEVLVSKTSEQRFEVAVLSVWCNLRGFGFGVLGFGVFG